MAINRRKIHNPVLRDALLSTVQGRTLAVQAKTEAREIGQRIRQLKELVHSTFVSNVPERFQRRFDIYAGSKDRVRALGQAGGKAYDDAVLKVKYAWTSREAFHEAVEALS